MTTTQTRRSTGASVADPGPVRYRRRRWPLLLVLGLVLALVAGAAYLLWRTPMFAVRTVSVTSTQSAPLAAPLETAIERATKRQLDSPLISVDLDAVHADVAAIPQVASVTVKRQWPTGLTLTVTPRVPIAVTSANGAWWLLDADGLPYTSTKTRPAGLPAVELATPGPHDRATAAALEVISALPRQVTARVATVRAPSPYQVTLVLLDGRTVIWGDGTRTAQKAQILPAVLQQPGKTFDLSDPTMVTVK